MPETKDPISAKARLAQSRAALLHEMGFNAPTAASGTQGVPAFNLAGSLQQAPRPSPWVSLVQSALRNWWRKHPANAALTLARPAFDRYAHAHPGKTLACGAAAGAMLYLVRPWRLLSLGTIAALVFQRSAIAGMVTHLAESFPAATQYPLVPARWGSLAE